MAVNGEEKMYMTFNTLASTSKDWLDRDRILDSSYTDLSSATNSFLFGVSGYV